MVEKPYVGLISPEGPIVVIDDHKQINSLSFTNPVNPEELEDYYGVSSIEELKEEGLTVLELTPGKSYIVSFDHLDEENEPLVVEVPSTWLGVLKVILDNNLKIAKATEEELKSIEEAVASGNEKAAAEAVNPWR